MTELRSVIESARRLVIKVGSSLVTNEGRGLDRDAITNWGRQLAQLRASGKQVVMVSSGAVAEGMQRLGWSKRPSVMNDLQAAAAVGQMGLAQMYETCFREHGLQTAQILLTHEDLADRKRYLNARATLTRLLALDVVAVINENDTVVTDEITRSQHRHLHGNRRSRPHRQHHLHCDGAGHHPADHYLSGERDGERQRWPVFRHGCCLGHSDRHGSLRHREPREQRATVLPGWNDYRDLDGDGSRRADRDVCAASHRD